jgi:glycosyltransferase involved in cell wall biosynthesis
MTQIAISLFFPVYGDEGTVEVMVKKSLRLLESFGEEHEIVIVDDASPDRSGAIADRLAKEHPCIRVIHHMSNLGYGAAVRSGLAACRFEYICLTDGDDQYEVDDFRKLLKLRDYYDLIITFRYKKVYSTSRMFISLIYNKLLRFMFRTPFRDVSTGLRMVRKSILTDIQLEASSPFIGAELAIKAMLQGYRVGEVGIQTFPRTFGQGSSTTPKNIVVTMIDLWRIYRRIFSDEYELPAGRNRTSMSDESAGGGQGDKGLRGRIG